MAGNPTIEFENGTLVIKEVTRINLTPGEVLAVQLPYDADVAHSLKVLKEIFKNNKVLAYKGELQFRTISAREASDIEFQQAEEAKTAFIDTLTDIHGLGHLNFRVEYINKVEVIAVTAAERLGYSYKDKPCIADILRDKISKLWSVEPTSFKMEFK